MNWIKQHLASIAIAVIAFAATAYAANSTLYNLSAASSVAGTDVFYDVQTSGTGGVKASAAQIAAYEAKTNGFGYPASYYLSSNWYSGYGALNTAGGSQAVAANTVYCAPGWVTASVTIKALGAYVLTGASTTNAQFAVYSESGGTLTLVDSTANVASATSTTAIHQTVANTTDTLSPGVLYFWCTNDSGTPVFGATGNVGLVGYTIGSATESQVLLPSGGQGVTGISWSATLGTWASTEALSSTSNVANASGAIMPYVVFEVN